MLRTIGFRLNNAVSNFEYKIVLLSSGARMQETVDFSYYKVLLRTVFLDILISKIWGVDIYLG